MSAKREPWVELTTLRTKDGHSKTSLALAAGISLGHLSDLESGRREPNERITKLLAQTLNVPLSVLEKHRVHQDGAA